MYIVNCIAIWLLSLRSRHRHQVFALVLVVVVVVVVVVDAVVVVGVVIVVVARTYRLWNHSIVGSACVLCCCRCCCHQFLAWLDHFNIFDDVTTTSSPLPLVATGNLYFRNLHNEFRLCTNFQHDWSILKFWMTLWQHPRPNPSLSLGTFIFLIYIPKLVSIPIFSLFRTFLNFRWRRRPAPLRCWLSNLTKYIRRP